MVEAQHVASTMKLVDSLAEQDLLEELIEGSKPSMPRDVAELDYLLATPFRYDPPKEGSRFRGTGDPGVFYGAQSVRTASAELGYWRWKFLHDAADLERIGPVAHTAFRTQVRCAAVDLRSKPFVKDAKHWRHPTDYRATQAFARVAREADVVGIIYESVRDPQPAWCVALLTPSAFASPKPHPETQTWFLAVTKEGVAWRRGNESLTFSSAAWK